MSEQYGIGTCNPSRAYGLVLNCCASGKLTGNRIFEGGLWSCADQYGVFKQRLHFVENIRRLYARPDHAF
jgi:hypothetical protein